MESCRSDYRKGVEIMGNRIDIKLLKVADLLEYFSRGNRLTVGDSVYYMKRHGDGDHKIVRVNAVGKEVVYSSPATIKDLYEIVKSIPESQHNQILDYLYNS